MKTLDVALKEKILLLDGAMGTMIQQRDLTAEDFGGEEYEGCNEYLVVTRPDVIQEIHEEYIDAGSDIIETNTFGATNIVLSDYNLQHLDIELNEIAARIAKQAVVASGKEVYVAGAMGPTTKAISVTGGVTFDELITAYNRQATGLINGGVDVLLVETCQDMRNVKAACIGISNAFNELNKKLPVMISGTIEPMGTTLAGQTIDAFYLAIEHISPISIGLNCATGPEFMRDHVRTLSELSETFVSCYPNAGLPDEDGHYHESPESLAHKVRDFAEQGWINIIGGCCGTTPEHIRAMKEAISGITPRQPKKREDHAVSGLESLRYDDSMRPLFVGERTNVIGSRKFKNLIADGKFEEASEIARAQVKKGAHVIDVCMADPDRDEVEDMENFIKQLVNKVKVPIMIDSTDENVIELALTYIQGKAIINSINLEDGEERFEKILPFIHKYGAAVVVGTIDEDGMAVSAERKLEIAKRSYQLLTEKYKIRATDIIFDPLVFPVGTGDTQYIGSAKATIDGIQLIKDEFPECLTILGLSNISFGLPNAGREVLNAVFLYHSTKAGLDYAIVNTEKLERFASIPAEERELAENLLFHTSQETLDKFVEHFRNSVKKEEKPKELLPIEERLAACVIEGSKQGLIEDLQACLDRGDIPLNIINGPLMTGMDEVGRLFNNNELIVAEVLQSAEVMKASVNFLEQFMEKTESSRKGKVILATVKGDVHDIGKNLVDIILTNNGFDVVNLGINIRPDDLITKIRENKPDIIGLSGLLVKSAQQMVITAGDLKSAGINTPILVGGAALTRKFTENRIQPIYDGLVVYSNDAMTGLDLANKIVNPDELKALEEKKKAIKKIDNIIELPVPEVSTKRSAIQKSDCLVPSSLSKTVIKNIPVAQVAPFINYQMLIGHHLGVKGKWENQERGQELYDLVQEFLKDGNEYFDCQVIYQFFPAQSEGNDVIIYDSETKKPIERFQFPRQRKEPNLCISDFLNPVGEEMDYVGFFSVTSGPRVRNIAERLKQEGEYLKSHVLFSLALELAEGLAEKTHMLMREKWGFPDRPDFTMSERFKARYQGIRVSFGYPACPNLEDQEKLFKLINPNEIGINLTEGFMMLPEASVTAMVFSHKDGRYFSV
ncbi:methionine synthase [Bacillus sp. FJAT-25509]|uniref:methionine synthase n=1 Tax=Bacillus sp. FJAT-25509 TaxID=1712029 RepID=UPI0007018F6D|nr:methionine synthase [Bacillus sp. FJAT-25509]KQL32979.1 methionine synthase [Bacillus sp. FJAT-25509]